MELNCANAEVFTPGGDSAEAMMAKTTDLCIAAHQDDIEIMAYGPIVACFDDPKRFFSGCVVTDGAGSPRSGRYAGCTDEQMKEIRVREQKNAASIGNYAAQVFLGYPSSAVKNAQNRAPADDIEALLLAACPRAVYTHNLADKHDTHVAVALRVVEACRRLPAGKRPEKVYSMEVWRGLDWMRDCDKALFDTTAHPGLAAALLGVYDSQVSGGKRYDSAALGRRLANATFFESHQVDVCESVSYGLDITDLAFDRSLSPQRFIRGYIDLFAQEVQQRIEKFM